MLRILINLDRAKDRRANMEAKLASYGVKWVRVPAFDCREFEAGFVDEVYAKSGRVRQDPGSIGSFMTHRECWRRLVASDEQHALIMEDDLLFGKDCAALLKDANWLPSSHDKCVVHLETFGRVTVIDVQAIASIGQYGLHVMHRLHHGSAAYLIHRDTAKKALAGSTDLNNVPDEFLFMPPPRNLFSDLPVLQAVPSPFVQEDIHERMGGAASKHHSMIAATRKGARKGLTQLHKKLTHSLGKQWTIVSGKLTDGIRGQKTGVIPFQ
ncbi:MAG: glycosyltransferase family 25 protein [Pseudomonadota bacterium]